MEIKKKSQKGKYLDPKNDLTFRKIFGEHPHLLISFLNSILPLEEEQLIVSLEYQDIELIPELPSFKRSFVDVRCTDNFNRQFIVEMQMYWTSSFRQRMLFNSGKAYVKQLPGGGKYRDLKPVYGLCLIDDNFTRHQNLKTTFYHHYKMVHSIEPDETIDGLELIFIELPKFKAQNHTEKRLQYLWLRFLTEIDENTESIPEELQNENLIKEALECVQKAAFSEGELEYYEQYWDAIRTEKAAIEEAQKQIEEAQEQIKNAQKQIILTKKQIEKTEKQKQEAENREEATKIEMAKMMLKYGESIEQIQLVTNLSLEKIEKLKK